MAGTQEQRSAGSARRSSTSNDATSPTIAATDSAVGNTQLSTTKKRSRMEVEAEQWAEQWNLQSICGNEHLYLSQQYDRVRSGILPTASDKALMLKAARGTEAQLDRFLRSLVRGSRPQADDSAGTPASSAKARKRRRLTRRSAVEEGGRQEAATMLEDDFNEVLSTSQAIPARTDTRAVTAISVGSNGAGVVPFFSKLAAAAVPAVTFTEASGSFAASSSLANVGASSSSRHFQARINTAASAFQDGA